MEKQYFQITPQGCCFLMLAGLLFFGLLFPAFIREREAVRRSLCADRMRKIAMALAEYQQVYGSYPPLTAFGPDGKPYYSWRVLLLPFLGEMELYESIQRDEPWNSPKNQPAHLREPAIFHCPNNPAYRYALIKAPEKAGNPAEERFFLIEQPESTVWMQPSKTVKRKIFPENIPPPHSGGMNIAAEEGNVWFCSEAIDPSVEEQLLKNYP